jgi:TatD DNase family protein
LAACRQTGPFPSGVLLHSYLGSAEMVLGLANLGCYFSLSGFLTGMKSTKAKKMLKAVSRLFPFSW